ncbi:MAG: hypothetical protein ABEJ93_00895 [Candidatus Nanohalobium sp.]
MFESDKYTIKEKSFSKGDQFKVFENGELVMFSKVDDSSVRDDMIFVDVNEDERLKVTSNPLLDIPVSYSIVDQQTGEVVGGLKREWGFLQHKWKVVDADNRIVGEIKEDNLALSLTRRFLTTLLPFKYDFVSGDGEKIADIDGKLTVRDIYTINIKGDVDPRLVVPAALIMDFIEKK